MKTLQKPNDKVVAGGVAGAVAVILAFVLSVFGVVLPPEVTAAVTVVLMFAASYIKPEGSRG